MRNKMTTHCMLISWPIWRITLSLNELKTSPLKNSTSVMAYFSGNQLLRNFVDPNNVIHTTNWSFMKSSSLQLLHESHTSGQDNLKNLQLTRAHYYFLRLCPQDKHVQSRQIYPLY